MQRLGLEPKTQSAAWAQPTSEQLQQGEHIIDLTLGMELTLAHSHLQASDFARESLLLIQEYRVLICKPCGYGIKPSALATHFRKRHQGQSHAFATAAQTAVFVRDLLNSLPAPLLDPDKEQTIFPETDSEALPGLRLGIGRGCNYCAAVYANFKDLLQHYNVKHAPLRRARGGKKNNARGKSLEQSNKEHFGDKPVWHEASYQRFFAYGHGSRRFRVKGAQQFKADAEAQARRQRASALTRSDFISDEVFRSLAQLESDGTATAITEESTRSSHVSPWLERTRWTSYLCGVQLCDAAQLARFANRSTKPLLVELSDSIDRLVAEAYQSVRNDRVSFFCQRNITSFLPSREIYSRPLVWKLQKTTYRRYVQLWQRLMCFVSRSSNPPHSAELRHRLTSRQTALFDTVLALGAERVTMPSIPARALDRACLAGDMFDSVFVGFLAVLGIDESNDTFYEAPNYTPMLSGLIKIAQMLVVQKAAFAVEDGHTEEALDALEDMRARFMTLNNCTPFTWAVSLRSFGKRIRDSITSLGYIQWSEDGHTVFYRNLELRISAFQAFVRAQVERTQTLLEDLFLLSNDEQRQEIVPKIALYRVRDNPAMIERGWTFLKDPRNVDTLPARDNWMLQRVLRNSALRDESRSVDRDSRVKWRSEAIKHYQKQVDAFLVGLLLLVHITSGQPARGTEIIGLRHTNTTHHRNIFIEDGLVSIVTSNHKGYTYTGTTKIIHRYLPHEVGELLVYYVWLIRPFIEKLDRLTGRLQKKHEASAFLWPDGIGTWAVNRLSKALQRETEPTFGSAISIAVYRHVAIALSRRHVNGKGFSRDFDVEEKASDRQTTHTLWTAGRLYARGLEEAPGHVEARRAEFRAVSRRWHAFLGFVTSSPAPPKRPFEEVDQNVERPNL